MVRTRTSWKKGQSGNAKGSSPPQRPLASALAAAGEVKDEDGFTPKEKVSKLIWEFMRTGRVVFPGNEQLHTGPRTLSARTIQEWIDGMKFVYRHLDGDAPKHVSLDTPNLNLAGFAYEQLEETEKEALRDALIRASEMPFDPETIPEAKELIDEQAEQE